MGKYVHQNTLNAAATGQTHIGFTAEAFPAAISEAEAVVVEQVGAADAGWNVLLDGQRLFSAGSAGVTVGAADTPEVFVPNASTRGNLRTANAVANLAAEVIGASATQTSKLHMTVLTDDNRAD